MMQDDLPYYIRELNDLQVLIEKKMCSTSQSSICKKTKKYQERKRKLLNLLIETLEITL